MRVSWTSAALVLLAAPGAMAQAGSPLPACALSGAASVMIGGRPVLRLSDVATCPPELYEVVPSIRIEGQPAVRFRSGGGITGACSATGDPSVRFEGQAAPRLGDVECRGR